MKSKMGSIDSSRLKKTIFLELLVGSAIRLFLTYSSWQNSISNRIEISTFLNSWKRVTEGVTLYQEGINPYDGDIFHETPLALVIFDHMLRTIPRYIGLVFIFTDLLTSYLLFLTARNFMQEESLKQEKEKTSYAPGTERLLLSEYDQCYAPIYVLSAYLFSPYTVLSSVGFSTTTFGNLCLATVFYSMIKRYRIIACTSLALATLQSLYPVVLIVPVCLYMCKGTQRKFLSCFITVLTYTLVLGGLIFLSFTIIGDWSFYQSIYMAILTIPNLRPNIGLFWYFFTEMFEHFRLLFVFSFQLNALLLYLAPLSLRFHYNPMLLATSLISLSMVFKSYPSIGDVGFYLSLLPMWTHVGRHMQQTFIIVCSILVTSVLGPTVWYLWIYSQSANANFYFGVTLTFATAQIFLITDLLFGYIKREFSLRGGLAAEQSKQVIKFHFIKL